MKKEAMRTAHRLNHDWLVARKVAGESLIRETLRALLPEELQTGLEDVRIVVDVRTGR